MLFALINDKIRNGKLNQKTKVTLRIHFYKYMHNTNILLKFNYTQ